MRTITLAFLEFFVVSILLGCSPDRDSTLEEKFSNILISHQGDNTESLDLRTIFGVNWRKACLQGPYMEKTYFEKASGEKASEFQGVSDDRYVLWVFYQDGEALRINIERMKVMDKYYGTGTHCTGIGHPFIYFGHERGRKRYYLNDRGV